MKFYRCLCVVFERLTLQRPFVLLLNDISVRGLFLIYECVYYNRILLLCRFVYYTTIYTRNATFPQKTTFEIPTIFYSQLYTFSDAFVFRINFKHFTGTRDFYSLVNCTEFFRKGARRCAVHYLRSQMKK